MRFPLLLSLCLFAALWGCDSTPPPPNPIVEEGFSFANQPVLHLYGEKDPDLHMELMVQYISFNDPCRGMKVLDILQDLSVSKPSIPPKEGGGGFFWVRKNTNERKATYAFDIPLSVTHPQCTWQISDFRIRLENDFMDGGPGRDPNEGGTLFSNFSFEQPDTLKLYPDIAKGQSYWPEFPATVYAECYNTGIGDDRKFLDCFMPYESSRNIDFPAELRAHNATMRIDLKVKEHLEDIITWDDRAHRVKEGWPRY